MLSVTCTHDLFPPTGSWHAVQFYYTELVAGLWSLENSWWYLDYHCYTVAWEERNWIQIRESIWHWPLHHLWLIAWLPWQVSSYFGGGQKSAGSGNRYLTERNAERLADALCRMRGAALKLGQMISIQDESVLPPQVPLSQLLLQFCYVLYWLTGEQPPALNLAAFLHGQVQPGSELLEWACDSHASVLVLSRVPFVEPW